MPSSKAAITASSINPHDCVRSNLFNEKLQLSEKLVDRFVTQEVINPGQTSETKLTKKQKIERDAAILAKEKRCQRELEAAKREADENFNLFQVGAKFGSHSPNFSSSDTPKSLKLPQTRNLPEFSSLHSKVRACTGTINLAHANLGDERCIIFSVALNENNSELLPSQPSERNNSMTITVEDYPHQVSSLSLCDNRITDNGMVEVMRNLTTSKRLCYLKHLDLSDNKVGRGGAMALAQCVCALPQLQWLNVSNMRLSDGVLHDMLSLLGSSGGSSSEDSEVNECEVASSSVIEDDKPRLRSLKLSRNQLSVAGSSALASYLRSSSGAGLLELDVSWNNLGIEGGAKLWKALSEHECLIALDLSWNSLGDHHHEEVAEKRCPLADINPFLTAAGLVEGEGSMDTGAGSSITFKKETKVKPAKIESKTGKVVTPGVSVAPIRGRFKKVKAIPYQSATALSDLLTSNDTLRHLNVSHNAFCAKECEIIGEGLTGNRTLLGLHITGWLLIALINRNVVLYLLTLMWCCSVLHEQETPGALTLTAT